MERGADRAERQLEYDLVRRPTDKSPLALLREARELIRKAEGIEEKAYTRPVFWRFASIKRSVARDRLIDSSILLHIAKPESAAVISKEAVNQGNKALDDYKKGRAAPHMNPAELKVLERELEEEQLS